VRKGALVDPSEIDRRGGYQGDLPFRRVSRYPGTDKGTGVVYVTVGATVARPVVFASPYLRPSTYGIRSLQQIYE
jgi:hypothetical protein